MQGSSNELAMCEKTLNQRQRSSKEDVPVAISKSPSPADMPVPCSVCEAGFLTHTFLVCDLQASCWASSSQQDLALAQQSCDVEIPPSFVCDKSSGLVPYSLVCDRRQDCEDNSDEDFCSFPLCLLGQFRCDNGQCIDRKRMCDRVEQCLDGTDERDCEIDELNPSAPIPSIIDYVGGSFTYRELDPSDNGLCPESHFWCPDRTYCLPVYVICNGISDCRIDEEGCDSYVCPGFFRCRSSLICLHASHVCDGTPQCPQHDDERFCGLTCPPGCSCQGFALTCQSRFPGHLYPSTRYLNADGSGFKPPEVAGNTMMVYLSLSRCNIRHLSNVSFPNLKGLDLSNNQIEILGLNSLIQTKHLRTLILTGNPVTTIISLSSAAAGSLNKLYTLELSQTSMKLFDSSTFASLPSLRVLNISKSHPDLQFHKDTFNVSKNLLLLDLRGNSILRFPDDLLRNLDTLESIYTDNFKLCCPLLLPKEFNTGNCRSPEDELSSCDDLLHSAIYRIVLVTLAASAVLGNVVSFVARVWMNAGKTMTGHSVFVMHLCVSDFFMGTYLVTIGLADHMYQGRYVLEDVTWRNSVVCQMAGFLSLLSSETSALVICLITLDRFLALRFPFKQIHFAKKSAQVAMSAVWLAGIFIAGLPLLPTLNFWEFYSQTGICIPLPVTNKQFSGQNYSFAVMIVLNFSLFLLIAAGQLMIYATISSNSMEAQLCQTDSNRRVQDMRIARRLLLVVMSDFVCWFPISLLGLLARSGVAVPGEVNVATAILVLPLNSALNPFIYTVTMVMERRRRLKEKRLLAFIAREQHGKQRGAL